MFIAQIGPLGSALVYSTFLGGTGSDIGYAIAINASGDAYVTGATSSIDFPTVNPLQPYGGGSWDDFVAKISKPFAAVTLIPPSLDLGNQTIGISSAAQTLTITNSGSSNLIVTNIVGAVSTGSFVETNNCSSSLVPGSSCSVTLSWTPSTTGGMTGSITVTDNAPNSPQIVSVTGIGVLPAVTFSASTLTFPDQTIFTTSPTRRVTLTNTGLGILTINKIGGSGPFAQNNTCSRTVNAGANCTISVTFTPTTKGSLTGSIVVTDNAPGSPQKVTLKGTGTYVQLTPASLNFGNQPVGTKSLPKKITLSNKGGVAVSITSVLVTGTNAQDFVQTNTCGTTVKPGASCFIVVTFKPSAKGKRTASISVNDNGGGSPQKVSLTGTGT